jgi:hypothetical protein
LLRRAGGRAAGRRTTTTAQLLLDQLFQRARRQAEDVVDDLRRHALWATLLQLTHLFRGKLRSLLRHLEALIAYIRRTSGGRICCGVSWRRPAVLLWGNVVGGSFGVASGRVRVSEGILSVGVV